jgi:hypothetical protein
MQRPPVFEADDGFEYVLKLDSADPDFPAAELVAAGLAEPLGVRLPAYGVVAAPDLLTAALLATGDADLAEFAESFGRRGGTCFGSRYLAGVTVKWEPRLRGKVEESDRVLARLLVFDAFIENADRSSATNPNLLVSNGVLYAIDHGQALPSVQGITGKSLVFPFDSHISWLTVQQQPDLLAEPIASLRALPDAAIDAAVDAVPASWWTAPGRPAAVRLALRQRRAQLPDMLQRLVEPRR